MLCLQSTHRLGTLLERAGGTLPAMRRVPGIGVLIAASTFAFGQLGQAERQSLSDALYLANLESSDLIRARSHSGPDWVRSLINDPFVGMDRLAELRLQAEGKSLPQLLGFLRGQVYGDADTIQAAPATAVDVPENIPEPLRPSVKKLAESIQRSNELIRDGLSKLSAAERRTLIEALPRQALGATTVRFDFVRQPLPSDAEIQTLLERVDWKRIRFAGQLLAQDVQEEIPKLKEAAKRTPLTGVLKANVNGVVVEIGGTTDDLHGDNDAVLCIDLGGNDRYTGRYGAGVGYASVLIDLGGDDVYEGPDLSFGAGVLGVGLTYDLGGDDRLKGRSICFGAGIAGVGAFVKDGGDDDYRATSLSQGFGFHGIGLLIDTKGDDHYRVGMAGQGAAKSGGLGWLIDKTGRDTYRAGGLTDHPFYLESTLAFAQGAGEGAGAVGCLTDLMGIDVYIADSRAQGYGTRDGVGVLIDSGGRDSYSAASEAQSYATLSGGGYLWDAQGDDVYGLRIGSGHANASNYGLAVLLDQAGNDLYFGADSRPGGASANGAALFMEVQGDDRYAGPPGVGGAARGSGSFGIFVDMGGSDQYAEGLVNGQAKLESPWGSALDLVGNARRVEVPEPPKVGSKPIPDEQTMETLFRAAILDDRKAVDELTAIGEPALRWLIAKKLVNAGDAEVGLTSWIAIQVGGPAEEICVAAIDLSKETVAKTAIQICQFAGYKRAGQRIIEAIGIPGLSRIAVRAAGALEVTEAAPTLMALADGQDTTLKRIAITALGQIGDERSFDLMRKQLESVEPEMRFAAINLVTKFPQRALPLGKQLLTSANEKIARTAIELLAKLGTDEAAQEICAGLADPRRGVQIQALVALDGRVPKSHWANVVELRRSSDPLVKAVAVRIDLGR